MFPSSSLAPSASTGQSSDAGAHGCFCSRWRNSAVWLQPGHNERSHCCTCDATEHPTFRQLHLYVRRTNSSGISVKNMFWPYSMKWTMTGKRISLGLLVTEFVFLTVYSNVHQWNISGALGHPVGRLPGDSGVDNHCFHLLLGRLYWSFDCWTHDHTLWKVV